MTIRIVLLTFVCSVAPSIGVNAQTSPSAPAGGVASRYLDPAGLSLGQAIVQALEREPSLRAVRTDVDVARGQQKQAAVRPNPMVSFSQQEEAGGTDSQTRVEVVWPLDLFRKAGRVAVAERESETTRHLVADRERLLAADVRSKYGDVAGAIRALAVLDDLIAATSRQHELVAARVAQGATPPLERDMLRVELRRLESERLLQSGAVEGALIELKRALGMAADAPLMIRDDLEHLVATDTATASQADASAAQARPDVQAAQSRLQLAEARIEQVRRESRPDVSIFGMYMRMDSGFPQTAFGAGGGLEPIRGLFHYAAAGATVTIPLRDRKQGDIAAAQARRAGATAERDATQLAAQAEVAAARVRDEHARQAVAVYTADTRTLGRQNLTVVSQTYELGRATVFDVLAEQRRYLDLERAFTSALKEAYDARQALRRALGEMP